MADYAIWRPTDGNWWIIPSSNPNSPYSQQWGLPGDSPVAGDFDGDGFADFAVVRPSEQSLWLALNDGSGNYYVDQLGLTGSVEISYSTALNPIAAKQKITTTAERKSPSAKVQENSRKPAAPALGRDRTASPLRAPVVLQNK